MADLKRQKAPEKPQDCDFEWAVRCGVGRQRWLLHDFRMHIGYDAKKCVEVECLYKVVCDDFCDVESHFREIEEEVFENVVSLCVGEQSVHAVIVKYDGEDFDELEKAEAIVSCCDVVSGIVEMIGFCEECENV